MAAKRLRLAHPTGHERPPAAPGAPSGFPSAPATVLVVNTLTSKPGEAPRDFLLRNGLDDGPLRKMPLSLFAEFGVAHAEMRSRFNGVTFALLRLEVPAGMQLPFESGQAFAPSKGRLVTTGELFKQRFIQACAGGAQRLPSHSHRRAQGGLCHWLNSWHAWRLRRTTTCWACSCMRWLS